ncbi:hypothetical protein LTR74_000774 [Friedmanniomyces endolithicus]|nr:hypothetical protein LTR74_000774 [Friedmanniomyces endolithicus]
MAKSKPDPRPSAASVRGSAIANYRVRPSPLGQVQPRVQKSAAGAHLDIMLKAEAIKRMAPHATSSGSHSVPVAENAEGQRRAHEGSTELERTVQRFRERDVDTEARLSGVQRAVSDLYGTMQALQAKLEGRVSVSMGTGQVIVHGENQHLAQQRLAHLERENLELRQREAESQAQIAGLTEGYNRMYNTSRAHEDKLRLAASGSNKVHNFFLKSLAEAVAWNRLQWRNEVPGRDPLTAGPGFAANLALDGGELDWTELEEWLGHLSRDMRDVCGEPWQTRVEELIRGLHARRYGMMPEEEEFEEEEEEEEEDDDQDDELDNIGPLLNESYESWWARRGRLLAGL